MAADDPRETWRRTLERCVAALSARPGVRALAVVGSGADASALDRWSDLDLVVVVAETEVDPFFRGLPWLDALGTVYAVETSGGGGRLTVRTCFMDLTRVDFILVAEPELPAFAAAPGPLQGGARVVLDRTAGALAQALARVPPRGDDPAAGAAEAFRRLEAEFRWNGVLAAAKIGRGDLLIGGHLALEMAQACLVLEMLLRDRGAGTRHHRHGDGAVPELPLPRELSAAGIADLIVAAADRWSLLGARWDPDYVFPKGPLLALLGRDG